MKLRFRVRLLSAWALFVAATPEFMLGQACAHGAPPWSFLHLARPGHVLEWGGVTLSSSGPVVTGMEVDEGVQSTTGDAVDSLVRVVSGREALDQVLPPQESTALRVGPIPVPLERQGFALLWGEPVPPAGGQDTWLNYLPTTLWYAEKTQDGWSDPELLLKAGIGIHWLTSRTVVVSPVLGALLMVTAEELPGGPSVWFGPVGGPMRPISLRSQERVVDGSFIATGDSLVAILTVIDSTGTSSFRTATSVDAGDTWRHVGVVDWSGTPGQSLRLFLDAAGDLHALQNTSLTEVEHLRRRAGASGWEEVIVPQPGDGMALGRVYGVDRCGGLVLLQTVATTRGTFRLQMSRFRQGRWINTGELDGYEGAWLFDGQTADGGWVVGWTGAKSGTSASGDALSVWLFQP